MWGKNKPGENPWPKRDLEIFTVASLDCLPTTNNNIIN
jgi:hypothetical protein